jgi:hypothetical protein
LRIVRTIPSTITSQAKPSKSQHSNSPTPNL